MKVLGLNIFGKMYDINFKNAAIDLKGLAMIFAGQEKNNHFHKQGKIHINQNQITKSP